MASSTYSLDAAQVLLSVGASLVAEHGSRHMGFSNRRLLTGSRVQAQDLWSTDVEVALQHVRSFRTNEGTHVP